MEPLARLGALGAAVGVIGGVVLVAGALGPGALNPQRLRDHAQAQAQAALADAGYPWARLQIDGSVGVLRGEAPDEHARQALQGEARRLLSAYVGVPGVVLGLDDRTQLRRRMSAEALLQVDPPGAGLSGTRSTAAVPLGEACEGAFGAAQGDERIQFAPASAQLDTSARQLIKRTAAVMQRCAQWRLVIQGHADAAGGQPLARRRAAVVAAEFLLQNVPVEQLETRALVLGTASAVPAGRADGARNRRVDLQLVPLGS